MSPNLNQSDDPNANHPDDEFDAYLVAAHAAFVEDLGAVLDLTTSAIEATHPTAYAALAKDMSQVIDLDASLAAILAHPSSPPQPAEPPIPDTPEREDRIAEVEASFPDPLDGAALASPRTRSSEVATLLRTVADESVATLVALTAVPAATAWLTEKQQLTQMQEQGTGDVRAELTALQHTTAAAAALAGGQETDVARVDTGIYHLREALRLVGPDHPQRVFHLFGLALGLFRRHELTNATADLREAAPLLEEARTLAAGPQHPQWQMVDEMLTAIRRLLGDSPDLYRSTGPGPSDHVGRELIKPERDEVATTARDAAHTVNPIAEPESLRAELGRHIGAARARPLIALGAALAQRYWRTGPGQPAAMPMLDEAIAALQEAYSYLEAGAFMRGQVAGQLGLLLGIRHIVHGSPKDDRVAGIELLEEALSFPQQSRVLHDMGQLTLGQLLLSRMTAAMRSSDQMMAMMMSGKPAEASSDVDRAALHFREILDAPDTNTEIRSAAETLLGLAETMQTLTGAIGGPGGTDLGALMKAMTALQELQQRAAARPAAPEGGGYLANLFHFQAAQHGATEPSQRAVGAATPPEDAPAHSAPSDGPDPLSLVVAAVALGASAGLEDTAATAVKDAYMALKALLRGLKVEVAGIERRPGSKAQQAALREDLQDLVGTRDGIGDGLLAAAWAVTDAVAVDAPAAAAVIGVDLKQMRIEFLRIANRDSAEE